MQATRAKSPERSTVKGMGANPMRQSLDVKSVEMELKEGVGKEAFCSTGVYVIFFRDPFHRQPRLTLGPSHN